MKKSIRSFITLTAIAVGSLLSSCEPIWNTQGDCSVHYRVPFTYTKNMLGTDAFSTQVKSVTLYVFDSAGRLALKKTAGVEALAASDYAMDVDLLPGRYSLLAWGEGAPAVTPASSFVIGGGDSPASVEELSASLPLEGSGDALCSNRDIVPLFHGYNADVEFPDTYGVVTLQAIDLMKDTNTITVALENLEGSEIQEDALTVSIEADNSRLDWANNVVGNTGFSYLPWSVTLLSSDRSEVRSGTNPVTGIFAELTTGRLMTDRKPVLVVHRKHDGQDIIRLDLVKFLCMVKGHYPGALSDQQYLDSIDRYTLTFFVDAGLNWYIAGGININGWKVVPPQDVEI